MKYESYDAAVISDDYSIFEFTSVGPKGAVRKRVLFRPTGYADMFDLALGDIVPDSPDIDDKTIINNEDRDKILATVARIIETYTAIHAERWVCFRGNTKAKTRLYRMAISVNIKELSKRFEIHGVLEDDTVLPFETAQPFYAFLVRRKTGKFIS
jgi:hypothetical protein